MQLYATKTHLIIISFLKGRNHYHTSFDLLSLHAAVGHTLCVHEASQRAVWPRRRLFFFLLSHTDALPSAGAPNGGESKRSNWLHCVSALAQGLVFHRGGEEIKEPWDGGAKERNKPIKTPFFKKQKTKKKPRLSLGSRWPGLVAQRQVLAIIVVMILPDSGQRRSYILVFSPLDSAKTVDEFY